VPIFIFLGWIAGVLLAAAIGVIGLVALGVPVVTLLSLLAGTPIAAILPLLAPIITALGPLGAALAALLSGVSALLGLLLVLVTVLLAYLIGFLIGYALATVGVAGSFPPGTTFPLPPGTTSVPPPLSTVPVATTPTPAEFFGRGWMIGLNAGANFILLMLLLPFNPIWAPILAAWAFILISLSTVIFVARNRVFQGFLGWSAWLFPLTYVATFPGLLLFLFNTIASAFSPPLPGLTPLALALDFTTGVVESSEGFITRLSGFGGGFTQGNFTFLMRTTPAAAFTTSSISSHEVGHSLNTAAMGGVVLWINAIDENVVPFRRMDLAYGELCAESHARVFGTGRVRFFVNLWF
jgi:hypothetical protein